MPGMTHIGKYLIRRELGKGSMGVVYEGFDPVLQRRVAIKTILPAQLVRGEAADVLARFKREAQAAGRLNHPGIVGVYDYGEVIAQDDQPRPEGDASESVAGQRVAFIAMEFIEGRELKDHFDANECFSLPEVARIMVEILDALAHSHSQGVTHRDIKPSNLIMLANGKVKIADFGIARTETSELTQAGAVLGTPAYMSPEQFQGMRVDLRSDIFACGVVLYQFLTGEKPFTGHPTTIMYKVLREDPTVPSALNVSLSGAWDAVLTKALAKHPDDRFQSAGEFAAGIREALALQPSGFGQSQSQSLSAALEVDDDGTRMDPQPASAPAPVRAQPVARPDEAGLRTNSKASSKPGLQALPAGKARRPVPVGVLWGGMGFLALLALLVALGVYLRPAGNENGNGAPVSDQAKVPLTPPVAAEVPVQPVPPVSAAPSTVAPAASEAAAPVAVQIPAQPAPAPTPAPAPAIAVEPPAPSAPTPTVSSAPIGTVPAPLAKAPAPRKLPAASIAPPAALALPAPRPAMPKPNSEQSVTRSPRCALILQKAGVDEPISADDRAFLKSSCR